MMRRMSTTGRPRLRFRRVRGVTLIEVLVAFLLLSLGLLGMSAMHINALQNKHSALQRSQASMLAHFKMDALRANREAAIAGLYNLGVLGTLVCTPPADTNLVTHDQRTWLLALRGALGDDSSTCGLVACVAAGGSASCTVRVDWDDTRGTGGTAAQRVEIVSQI
jgi:type IV pilus assembly protein PilV